MKLAFISHYIYTIMQLWKKILSLFVRRTYVEIIIHRMDKHLQIHDTY